MVSNRPLLALIFIFWICNPTWSQIDQPKFDSLLLVMDEIHNDSNKHSAYRQLAKYSSNPDVSIFYGSKALDIAEKMNYEKGVAQAHLDLSNPTWRKGDLEESLAHILTALEISTRINDDDGRAACLNALGVAYINQENYETAIEYLTQAISMNSLNESFDRLANDYNNIGEAYRLWKKLDKALLNFERALELYVKAEITYGIAYSTGNIGLVYAEQGNYELAEIKMNEATLILNNLGDKYPIAVYQTYMADIYQERGDIELALTYAHKSLDNGEMSNIKDQVRDANLKLSELYSGIKEYQQAYKYQSQYLVYRDSINSEETIRKMADLRTEYEVSQKQIEVDLLSQEKRAQQAIGWGMISGLSLLTLLAMVLYVNNKKRKKMNLLLEEQKEKLQRINNTKDKFFSIISHDLRGPVASFSGLSQLIKMYVSSNQTDELIELTEDIDKSVQGVSDLLDNLLNWAIQQQGHIPNIPEKVALNDIVQEMVNTFENTARGKEISLTSNVKEDLQLWVDRNSTMTIVRNLVNNALKFTKPGGEVTIHGSLGNNEAIIKVMDTGIGISGEKLEELFVLKDRKRSWGTDGEKGLGIGLQLVYEFVEMNNGTLEVESEEGKGTSFVVKLPLFENNPVQELST